MLKYNVEDKRKIEKEWEWDRMRESERKSRKHTSYTILTIQQSDVKNWQKMLNFNEENRVRIEHTIEEARWTWERGSGHIKPEIRIEAKNNFPGEKIQKKWNKRALLQ